MTKSCIFGALLSALVLVGCDRDVHVDNRSQGEGGGEGGQAQASGGAGGRRAAQAKYPHPNQKPLQPKLLLMAAA